MTQQKREREVKCELYNDHFQNYKGYAIPRAQLVIADIPYNLGKNAYASSLEWWTDGDSTKGATDKAGKAFFDTDEDFRIAEFMHFCSTMLISEPKSKVKEVIEGEEKQPREKSKSPCMIVFCAFQQMQMVIEYGEKYGFKNYIPLVFIKKSSSQVLKANMKIVGATEYGLVLYRERLPKFNNNGRMIMNWFDWEVDNSYPKLHPTQKPIPLLKKLIEIFTDIDDVVIDPVAGSGSTLRAAVELNRSAYGFEIKKDFYKEAKEKMLSDINIGLRI
jgi:site-specific DNA-methyltransferase (adenine-specific)